jgi:hypothetical protein
MIAIGAVTWVRSVPMVQNSNIDQPEDEFFKIIKESARQHLALPDSPSQPRPSPETAGSDDLVI